MSPAQIQHLVMQELQRQQQWTSPVPPFAPTTYPSAAPVPSAAPQAVPSKAPAPPPVFPQTAPVFDLTLGEDTISSVNWDEEDGVTLMSADVD